MDQILKDLKFLKIYSAVLTVAFLALLALQFWPYKKLNHQKELTLERLNIVEPDGSLKMVISNAKLQHPGMIDKKLLPARAREAGIIFFNSDGDECGGLVYDGNSKEAGFAYSIDQFKNDQIMQIQYSQSNGEKVERSYGFKLWDRDDRFPLSTKINYYDSLKRLKDTAAYSAGIKALKEKNFVAKDRLFLGKTVNDETGLFLNDNKGNPRLKIYIDKENRPIIQTINEDGTAVNYDVSERKVD